MITLTRLSGTAFALNSDLIERIDSTPDTVITLVDGTKYVVLEDLATVVAEIRAYRGAVIAESARLADVDSLVVASRALLAIVARTIAPALEQVSMQQFRVLVVLVGLGPHRLGALADRLLVSQAAEDDAVIAAQETFEKRIEWVRLACRGSATRPSSPGIPAATH